MAEDLGDEDVVGHVFGFEAVAADSGVGASQVAWFPRKGEGTEGSRNVLGALRAGGVDGVWGGEAFKGAELAARPRCSGCVRTKVFLGGRALLRNDRLRKTLPWIPTCCRYTCFNREFCAQTRIIRRCHTF